jgi:flagellar biosynthesis protein FlhG
MIGQTERILELNKLKTQQQSKIAKKGKIVAFSSGKGGTGKTFLSLNVAYAISRINRKVLLIDLDSNLSNINILLNITAQKTLLNFFQHKSSLKELVTVYETNLHIIFGDSGKINYPQLKENDIEYLMKEIRELSEQYDYTFLDISAGATNDIIQILANSDKNLIITNPDPTAVMDAYVIIKLLHNCGSITEKYIVVNKSFSNQEGLTCYNNISKAASHFLKEKVSLLGLIDYDQSVSKSIMAQELISKNNPRSKISLQIIKLAQNLVKILQVANNNQIQK